MLYNTTWSQTIINLPYDKKKGRHFKVVIAQLFILPCFCWGKLLKNDYLDSWEI